MARNKNHNLFKRTDTWYFRKRVSGRWIKKALSKNLTEARRLRDQYLKEILIHGDIEKSQGDDDKGPLFGELAEKWAKIKSTQIKTKGRPNHHKQQSENCCPYSKIVSHCRSLLLFYSLV